MQRILFFFLFCLVAACLDPLNVEVTASTRRLVVDGLVTNRPGPYTVRLIYSNPISTSKLRPFDAATGAAVSIVDDLGNNHVLVETSPGVYETDSSEFRGQTGRGYYLSIEMATGKYQSGMQYLMPSGIIDDVYLDFEQAQMRVNNETVDGFGIYVDARGVLQEDNLFRWRWTTIHTARSYPERKVRPTPGGDIPTPEPCSGVIYSRGEYTRVGECTCCFCWSFGYSENTIVSKNEYVSANTFKRQFLGYIPVTSMHFFDRYFLDVEQLSLSEEAYEFWNLVEKQQKASLDLFQPNAMKIRGNMRCITDPAEEVLGFFGVSGVTSMSLFIDPGLVPVALPPIDTIPYSCLDYFPNVTTDRPVFW